MGRAGRWAVALGVVGLAAGGAWLWLEGAFLTEPAFQIELPALPPELELPGDGAGGSSTHDAGTYAADATGLPADGPVSSAVPGWGGQAAVPAEPDGAPTGDVPAIAPGSGPPAPGAGPSGAAAGSGLEGSPALTPPPGFARVPAGVALSPTPSVAALEAAFRPRFESLQAQCEGELERLAGQALAEYRRLGGTVAAKSLVGARYLPMGRRLETTCRRHFDTLLSDLEGRLRTHGLPLESVSRIRRRYEARVAEVRASLLARAGG